MKIFLKKKTEIFVSRRLKFLQKKNLLIYVNIYIYVKIKIQFYIHNSAETKWHFFLAIYLQRIKKINKIARVKSESFFKVFLIFQ